MRILLSILLFATIVSCKSKKVTDPGVCPVTCTTLVHHLELNYPRAQVDTIIVRTFNNDSSFTHPISEELQFPTEYDNSYAVVKNAYMDFTISTDKNYEFIIPATTDTFRIWGLHIEERTRTLNCRTDGKSSPFYCYNDMSLRATLNGETINAGSTSEGSIANVMFLQFIK